MCVEEDDVKAKHKWEGKTEMMRQQKWDVWYLMLWNGCPLCRFSYRYPARKVLCAWYCRAFKMYCLNINKIMLSLHCDIWWCLKRVYNTSYCVSIFHAVAYRRWEVLWDVVLCCAVLAGRDKGEPNENLGSVKINRPQWLHCRHSMG